MNEGLGLYLMGWTCRLVVKKAEKDMGIGTVQRRKAKNFQSLREDLDYRTAKTCESACSVADSPFVEK